MQPQKGHPSGYRVRGTAYYTEAGSVLEPLNIFRDHLEWSYYVPQIIEF